MKKPKPVFYMFWIKSSRGTDSVTCRKYDNKPTKADLKADAEDWASGFCAWNSSENLVTYGFKKIAKVPKTKSESSKLVKLTSQNYTKCRGKLETLRKKNIITMQLHQLLFS